jgi:hypothetical protein
MIIICDLCRKLTMYVVTINGYTVCEECTDKARNLPKPLTDAPESDILNSQA